MSDNSKKPESKAGEPKPPKTNAEDNRWYLLATLYGEPEPWNNERKDKNRATWNRYFAGNLDKKTREQLIEERWHMAEELTPFSLDESPRLSGLGPSGISTRAPVGKPWTSAKPWASALQIR